MNCAWDKLLQILPPRYRQDVGALGKDKLLQLHLRLDQKPVLMCMHETMYLNCKVRLEDLNFVVNTASRYSPWSSATTDQGYITAPGGHRIGLCGNCIIHNGVMTGVRDLTSLCVRVARDVTDIAPQYIDMNSSVLIIGPPGSGKTTMLRDLIRRVSDAGNSGVAVVDERGELFPPACGFRMGANTDVLTGCSKAYGIMVALRALGAQYIALDEITSEEDCAALLKAQFCGVHFIATAHAFDMKDLYRRSLYKELIAGGNFGTVLIMQRDKSCRVERVMICNLDGLVQ